MVAYTYILTLLAATAALATPAPINDGELTLEARAGQKYICQGGKDNKGENYGEVSYDKAVGFFRDAKTNTGASGYPKKFDNVGNVMKFKKGCKKNVWELPLNSNGKPYDYKKKKAGNSPGPIRVYYTKNLKFCGIGAKEHKKDVRPNNPHNCALKK
ncbi:hypothetical protein QQS21_007664 [Conoideocrella luteorostrata]|uniref:Uncharacterized protein n=1 Tax=Conoideocrella luteorostrata TaxID=1105319 RepID=A0AAJ0FS71_9HYPO|nr:hypothetical protein QQS21_007664 [Conoideocrella luteorostrata]